MRIGYTGLRFPTPVTYHPPVFLTTSNVQAIADKHGLRGDPEPRPDLGMINEVWFIGDVVLRYAPSPDAVRDARIEAEMVPKAVRVGVRTPELLHFQDEDERGYTLFRRVAGVTLGSLPSEYPRYERCFRQMGRELAKLHAIKLSGDQPELMSKPKLYDSYRQARLCREEKVLTDEEVDWMEAWLRRLEALAQDRRTTLVHNDVHAWNVLVDPDLGELTAFLDWGNGGYGHPAFDFAGMPLQAMPEMLAGYVEEGGVADDRFMAALLWQGANVGLWEARKMKSFKLYKPEERGWWRWPAGGVGELKAFLESAGESWTRFRM